MSDTPLAGRQIAVFGSSTLAEEAQGWDLAVRVGAALGRAGARVLNGGYGGAMAAVSRGVSEAGGHVVGVTLDGFRDRTPNAFLTGRVHTQTLIERLGVLFQADGFVSLEGSVGTLTEFFLAWNHTVLERHAPRPVVCVGMTWPGLLAALQSLRLVDDPDLLSCVTWVREPEDVVGALLKSGRLAESLKISEG